MNIASDPYVPAEEKIRADLLKLVGHLGFPVTLTMVKDKLVSYEFETEWKEGTTTPVPRLEEYYLRRANGKFAKNLFGKKIVKHREVFDFEENYTDKKLTSAEAEKVETYLKSLVKK